MTAATAAREAESAVAVLESPTRRPVGRPKGARNKHPRLSPPSEPPAPPPTWRDVAPRTYRIAETALVMGVHVATVRRMLARGELRSARIGRGIVLVSRESVHAFLAGEKA